MNETRRALLAAFEAGPVTGPKLADRLDISRAAVWKQVEALRDTGFRIESTDEGYEVTGVPDYGAAAIEFGLDAAYTVDYHDSVGSTNDRARELAGEGAVDVAVVADEQTGGRGRLKRPWDAPSGGVWCSVVLNPDLPAAHVPLVALAAGVATVAACREAGVEAHLKWPNDVLVGEHGARGGQKLAGILTEMEGEADQVSWLIAGIGVNANIDAAKLPEGATSLSHEMEGDVDRRLFVQRLLESLGEQIENPKTVLDQWREYSSTLGKQVRIETSRRTIEGRAVDVQFPGALVVETETGREVVHAGDCQHLRPA
jgi:BirA family biotin operon repressor/biotin-[acetyl-CoA-carboxylase] ligase